MPESTLNSHYRAFLLWLSCALCIGVIAELLITGHYKEPLQLVPIVMSLAELAAAVVVQFRPSRLAIRALQAIMIVAGISGFVGVYAHLSGNLVLAQEVNPAKAAAAPLIVMLTGHNPPLAPFAMGVTAIVALAATYVHPALRPAAEPELHPAFGQR